MKQKVFIVLTVLWMVVIFMFSARPADDSTKDSNMVGMVIGRIFISGFDELSEDEKLSFAEDISVPVRKGAHAFEYAVLGFLMCGALGIESNRKRRFFFLAWILASVYAGTDEFHQLFVEGRSGQVSDVCLDSFGVLCGVVIYVPGLVVVSRKKDF